LNYVCEKAFNEEATVDIEFFTALENCIGFMQVRDFTNRLTVGDFYK